MSFPQSTRDQFLTLRADGISYAQCAKQLNVSRHTLIIWAKEMKPHLDALRSVRTEELLEQVQLRQEQRIILLAGFYHKVCQTIENTNLLSRGIAPLFTILLKLNSALDKYEFASSSFPIRENQCESVSESPSDLPIQCAASRRENPERSLPEGKSEIQNSYDFDPEKTEPPLKPEPETQNPLPQPIINPELGTDPQKTELKLNHPDTLNNLDQSSLSIRENQCESVSKNSSLPIQNPLPPSDQELEKLNKLLRRIDHAEAKIDRRAS